MTQEKSWLLWVDDDYERFEYERFVVSKTWNVHWATSLEDAVERLTLNEYRAMILDQMVPCQGVDARSPSFMWAASRLLWWIRGLDNWNTVDGERPEDWAWLASRGRALEANRHATTLIVSGMHVREVFQRIRDAEHHNEEIPFLSKPVDLDKLQRLLGRAHPASESQ